jgi:hypothetical protein
MKARRIQYSAAELAFVEARKSSGRAAIHAAFVRQFGRTDVTRDHIKALCTRNGWVTERERWTADDDATLRALYPDTRTEDLARRIGRSRCSTYNRAKLLGIPKSAAFLASPASGRTNGRQGFGTRFQKGQVAPNKGKRMPFHPNSAATRFKKGHGRSGVAVRLYKPIGTERLSKDGYLERKINDDMPLQARWRAVHLVRWEAIHGPLPKGMALKSLDGNRQNTDPLNWTLVPRGLLPRLHGKSGRDYDHAPAELKPTIFALARLEHAVREMKS